MWFPVGLVDQIPVDKPHAVQVGEQGVVLFRDGKGQVRALEDRCPHRRVPLSLGKVIDGNLRCAYHGWTFEGEHGRCVKIPNLDADERISPNLGADAYSVSVHEGFVYLSAKAPGQDGDVTGLTQQTSNDFLLTAPAALDGERSASGSVTVTMVAADYLAALFDGPHLLLSVKGVCITDFFLGDVTRKPDKLILDRTAIWSNKRKPPETAWGKSGLLVRTELCPRESVARLQLMDLGDQPLLSVLLAIVPGKRGTTQVHWRCVWRSDYAASAPLSVKLRGVGSGCPVRLNASVKGEAIADLLPGPSLYLPTSDYDSMAEPSSTNASQKELVNQQKDWV